MLDTLVPTDHEGTTTDPAGKAGRWLGLALVAAALAACTPIGPGGMDGGMGSDGGMGMPGGMGGEHRVSGGSGTDVPRSEPLPDAREIVVEAGDMYFQPRTIRLVAGEPVNLTVTNGGAAFHDLTIPELGFVVEVPSGTAATGGLVVEEPGQYPFECSVPGHAGAGMTGTLVVEDG